MNGTVVEVTINFNQYRDWYWKVTGQSVALKPTDNISVVREHETTDYGERGYHVIAWATYFVPTRFLTFGRSETWIT